MWPLGPLIANVGKSSGENKGLVTEMEQESTYSMVVSEACGLFPLKSNVG